MGEQSSATGGVKAFPIEDRWIRQRERLVNMKTPEQRAFRAQWIKDQHLAHHEPVHVPEIEKELRNPIRRFYRYPLDKIFAALEPALGTKTPYVRYLTGKFFIGLFTVYAGVYYFKYNANDWTRTQGWRVSTSKKAVYPQDPGYPAVSTKTLKDFGTRGFENSPI
ncbi:uncharacterized protein LOC128996516 [Macrosteles quadrilineatus]|uniref:uncharacterized protein LOC128996516 n=1 Tax=Macrosteles quadrilineatus TaxID=74068 RepID=UPI0023E21EBB|nr:uncharacterized protein LOC128996516 [Macrosteles quadrilineatus]